MVAVDVCARGHLRNLPAGCQEDVRDLAEILEQAEAGLTRGEDDQPDAQPAAGAGVPQQLPAHPEHGGQGGEEQELFHGPARKDADGGVHRAGIDQTGGLDARHQLGVHRADHPLDRRGQRRQLQERDDEQDGPGDQDRQPTGVRPPPADPQGRNGGDEGRHAEHGAGPCRRGAEGDDGERDGQE